MENHSFDIHTYLYNNTTKYYNYNIYYNTRMYMETQQIVNIIKYIR